MAHSSLCLASAWGGDIVDEPHHDFATGASVWMFAPGISPSTAHNVACTVGKRRVVHACVSVPVGDVPAHFEVVVNEAWGRALSGLPGHYDVVVFHCVLHSVSTLTRAEYRPAFASLFVTAPFCYMLARGDGDCDSPFISPSVAPHVYDMGAPGRTPAPVAAADTDGSGCSNTSSVTIAGGAQM